MDTVKLIAKIAAREFQVQSVNEPDCLQFNEPVGLYIHVPFCLDSCGFCPYNKFEHTPALADKYPQALKKEFELQKTKRFNSLYIGGGTPSFDLTLLENVLVEFGPRIKGEIAMEVHPGDATPEKLSRIKAAGVNYVSLGIQSFSDEILKRMDRKRQSGEISLRAIEKVLSAGFDFVDVDLIFDYELNSESNLKDFETALSFGPQQVSVYPMMRFTDTLYQGTKHDPESELEILDLLESAALKNNYVRDTLWTFKKKGESERYSSVSREFFLGLGTSASSFNGKEFRTNTFSLSEYYEILERRKLPCKRTMKLDNFSGSLYYSFWSLYGGKLDLKRLKQLFGNPDFRLRFLIFGALVGGYLKKHNSSLLPTKKGYRKLHIVEEWLTYHFIDSIWTALRKEARVETHFNSSL